MINNSDIQYIPILCKKSVDCSCLYINLYGITTLNFRINGNKFNNLNTNNISINEITLAYDNIELLAFNNFAYINGNIIYLRGIPGYQATIGGSNFSNNYYGICVINSICNEQDSVESVDAKICTDNINLVHVINPILKITGCINSEEFSAYGIFSSEVIQISEFGIDSSSLYCQKLSLPIKEKVFQLAIEYDNTLCVECISPLNGTISNNQFTAQIETKFSTKIYLKSIINGSVVANAKILQL